MAQVLSGSRAPSNVVSISTGSSPPANAAVVGNLPYERNLNIAPDRTPVSSYTAVQAFGRAGSSGGRKISRAMEKNIGGLV